MPMVEKTLNIFFSNNFQNVCSWGLVTDFSKCLLFEEKSYHLLLTEMSKCPLLGRHYKEKKVYYIFDDKRLELSHLDAVDVMGRTRVAESWELGSNSPIF